MKLWRGRIDPNHLIQSERIYPSILLDRGNRWQRNRPDKLMNLDKKRKLEVKFDFNLKKITAFSLKSDVLIRPIITRVSL